MLKFMRKYATGYMVKAIFGLIIVVFIFWGVGGLKDGDKTVAEVGPYSISMAEYQETYNRSLNMYRLILKDKLDENTLKGLKLKERTMDDLVGRYLLLLKAKELGLTVSDEEYRTYLDSIEAFKSDGKFNKKLFSEALKRNGMDPNRFEESEKIAILNQKMVNLIKDNGVIINDGQAWKGYVKARGKVDLAYMVFDPADYRKKVDVSDRELQDLYEKEKGSYIGENRYQLKYITIDEKSSIKDDAAYLDLLKAKSLEAYGKEKSLTVTDLGDLRESEVQKKLKNLKPQEWLKGLKKGDISLPIRADGKSYIFQVTELETGKPFDKASVIKELREKVSAEKAKSLSKKEAEEAIQKKAFNSKKDTGFLSRSAGEIPKIGIIPPEYAGFLTLSKDRPLYEKPVEIGGKYYVFSFKDEKAPDAQEWEKDKAAFKKYMIQMNGDAFFKSFMEDLKKTSKIKINWKEINVGS
ncbi:MAG: hypothetical protein C0392_03340 [Syntrophus sp. (in: bacteria)]|nr:hypothetical protein [Syntrophus sp. (in: bacteria)]